MPYSDKEVEDFWASIDEAASNAPEVPYSHAKVRELIRVAWKLKSQNAKLADQRAEIERLNAELSELKSRYNELKAISVCRCGDGFSLTDPGTCGNCLASSLPW